VRRPLNWLVVGISLAFLLVNLELAPRKLAGPSTFGMLRNADELDAALARTRQGAIAAGIPAMPLPIALPNVTDAEYFGYVRHDGDSLHGVDRTRGDSRHRLQ